MAEIARRTTAKHHRIMFIVHRQEIVQQAKQTFVKQNVNMNLAQVGMVQTFTRHIDRLAEPTIIFIDEAHHALAKSYQRIMNSFPKAIKLLFTATPWRMGGKGFEDVADDLIVGKPIKWLIDHGNLAPVDYYAPKQIDTQLLKVKRNGEFNEASITEAMKPKIYGNAVTQYMKLASGKQAIAYAYNVASAEKLADAFNQQDISAKAVSGKTKKQERNQIIRDYRNGKITILTNADLFTEGLDLPNVDCVIMLRPTKSLALYLQFSMRSMNPRNGKRAIIIDHVANVERFGLPTQERNWTLKGTDNSAVHTTSSNIQGVTVCEKCFATFYRKGDNCPFCGHLLTKEETIKTDEQAELEKVTNERAKKLAKKILENEVMKNVADKAPADLTNMAELKAYAKLHDYKSGWVFYQAKLKGLIRR